MSTITVKEAENQKAEVLLDEVKAESDHEGKYLNISEASLQEVFDRRRFQDYH